MQVSSTGFFRVTAPTGSVNTTPIVSEPNRIGTEDKKVVQDFLDYAKKTPAERLHDEILKSLGITEKQFNAMTPAQQQAVMQKVSQIMKEKLANSPDKTGQFVDTSA